MLIGGRGDLMPCIIWCPTLPKNNAYEVPRWISDKCLPTILGTQNALLSSRCPLYLLSCMSFKSHCSRRPRCSSLSSLRSQVPLRLARENSEWRKPATCNLQRDPLHCKPKARTEPAVSLGYSTSCCFGLGWGCVGWEYCNYSDVAGD